MNKYLFMVTNKKTNCKHFIFAETSYHAIELVKSVYEKNKFENLDYFANKLKFKNNENKTKTYNLGTNSN